MRFSVDHDFHIHSFLSRCSGDAAQTPEAMLSYAARFGLKKICVTDHFWDAPIPGASAWYRGQDLDHLRSILPLPEGEICFCFGAETEMDRSFRLGIAPQTFDAFDFVIISHDASAHEWVYHPRGRFRSRSRPPLGGAARCAPEDAAPVAKNRDRSI